MILKMNISLVKTSLLVVGMKRMINLDFSSYKNFGDFYLKIRMTL